jgi:hypothetical protein
MKIGITLGLTKENESLWSNGIKLNILYLAKLLMQIPNYEVFILDTSDKLNDLTKVVWDYTKYKTVKFKDYKYNLDLIIMMGTSLSTDLLEEIRSKNKKCKFVKYQCGNNYVIDMERVMFNRVDENALPSWESGHDETWFIPQQEFQNRHYYEIVYRQDSSKVRVVPFVWDSEQFDNIVSLMKQQKQPLPYYKPNSDVSTKRITVMEPNMNVVKYAMIPIMIAEKTLRDNGRDSFKKIVIGSGEVILKNNYFKKMLIKLDLVKPEPKISFVPRYPVTTFLSLETDIVLSHQWTNPLNYSYLDCLYFGFPLVHNADFISDAGYYYPNFDINKGAELLKEALYEHDNNIEQYNKRTQEVLNRYRSTNKDVIELYKKIIENLFVTNKHNLSYEYDIKTNLYK